MLPLLPLTFRGTQPSRFARLCLITLKTIIDKQLGPKSQEIASHALKMGWAHKISTTNSRNDVAMYGLKLISAICNAGEYIETLAERDPRNYAGLYTGLLTAGAFISKPEDIVPALLAETKAAVDKLSCQPLIENFETQTKTLSPFQHVDLVFRDPEVDVPDVARMFAMSIGAVLYADYRTINKIEADDICYIRLQATGDLLDYLKAQQRPIGITKILPVLAPQSPLPGISVYGSLAVGPFGQPATHYYPN